MSDRPAAEVLAESYPALELWPNLTTASTQQLVFLSLDCLEAGYGGAAGGGKSDALLAAALQYVDQPGYAALLLRRSFADLALPGAAMSRSHEWLTGKARWADRDKTWTFPSGATLTFGYLEHESDVYRYQSSEFQLVAFDELTQFSDSQYTYLFSRLRRRRGLRVPLRMRWASNPGGVGHAWVKQRFIDSRAPGVVFVPAKVSDNPGLDVDEYAKSLAHLATEVRAQLLDGDWGAFPDQAFPQFGDNHVVDRFPLEDAYSRIEACDYGLNGTAWYLIATDFDGNTVFVDSVYERDLLPDEVAALVTENRKAGWGFGQSAYADPSIWHRTGGRNRWGRPAVLADEFRDAGVPLIPANNDPRAGYVRLRTLIEPDPDRRFPAWHPRAGEHGAPQLFVVGPQCHELVEQLRTAPLQPIGRTDAGEKINPEWESRYAHGCAAARYGVMAKLAASTPPPKTLEEQLLEPGDSGDLRAERLRKHIENVQRPRRTRSYRW